MTEFFGKYSVLEAVEASHMKIVTLGVYQIRFRRNMLGHITPAFTPAGLGDADKRTKAGSQKKKKRKYRRHRLMAEPGSAA